MSRRGNGPSSYRAFRAMQRGGARAMAAQAKRQSKATLSAGSTVFVKASSRAKAYTRSTTQTTRSLRKGLKKGRSRLDRLDNLFSKINKEIKSSSVSGKRLQVLKSRRSNLIRINREGYSWI